MNEIIQNDVEFSEELYDDCIKILKKRNNKKYDFIMKAGGSLKKSLLALFKYVWTTEDKPEQWRRTTLIQLHKKNSKDDLGNYRNIHTKMDTPKIIWFHGDHLSQIPNRSKHVKISNWYSTRTQVTGTPLCHKNGHIFIHPV